MNGKIKHTNRKMKRPKEWLCIHNMKAHVLWANFIAIPGFRGKGEAMKIPLGEGAVPLHDGALILLPSVLVLLLLYIFRRLPTRFSFHALRLAASREQKGEREKREE